MNRRKLCSPSWESLAVLGVAALAVIALLVAGCPAPIEVAPADFRPDAAVAPMPPRPLCDHEPRELGAIKTSGDVLFAELVRLEDKTLLVRCETPSDEGQVKLRVLTMDRNGAFTPAGEVTDTGDPGQLSGMDATVGGGNLLVSLTRPGGHVDVLTLGPDGTVKALRQSIKLGADARLEGFSKASMLWFRGAPMIAAGNALVRLDGSPVQIVVPRSAGDGGPGDAGSTDGGADGGIIGTVEIPERIVQFVVAGHTLGWLRQEADGLWLDHVLEDLGQVISIQVASPSHGDVRVIWAGDRYVVGDSAGAEIARYIVARPRGRSRAGDRMLKLGGRMTLPRPIGDVEWTAWENTGARHLGLVQRLGPRHLRFLNVALSGLVLDAAIHLRRDRDVVAAQVIWDGRAYVVLWGERHNDTIQLFSTRFSCPDET